MTCQNILRIGTTEGRFRMIMPELIEQFGKMHPDTLIDASMAPADVLQQSLQSGALDLIFSGLTPGIPDHIEQELLFDEHLYLVISDEMARACFPDGTGPHLDRSADLKEFTGIPFCRSLPHLHCMQILDELLQKEKITLQTVHVSGHFDLHQELAVRNYAACFALTMYLPHLFTMNTLYGNQLHVSPIRGLQGTNPVYLFRQKGRETGPEEADFICLLKEKCRQLSQLDKKLGY